MFQKSKPARSPGYLRYVASKPCFGCGIEGFSQAAHPNQGKGMGLKTSDLDTFPLCAPHWGMPGCHWQLDNSFGMTRDERRALESEYTARMHDEARRDGRKEFKEAA